MSSSGSTEPPSLPFRRRVVFSCRIIEHKALRIWTRGNALPGPAPALCPKRRALSPWAKYRSKTSRETNLSAASRVRRLFLSRRNRREELGREHTLSLRRRGQVGLVLGCEAFRSCLRAAHSRGSHAATFLARPHCRPLARLEGRGPRFLKRRRASYQKFSGRKMRSWREPKIKNLRVCWRSWGEGMAEEGNCSRRSSRQRQH